MTGSGKSRHDLPLENSTPADAVPLESILWTKELHRRPSRPPDYEKENRALLKLVGALFRHWLKRSSALRSVTPPALAC